VGSRNLLTTASSGRANGLHAISDRLADSFSILPSHNGQHGGLTRPDPPSAPGADEADRGAKESLAIFLNFIILFFSPTGSARAELDTRARLWGGGHANSLSRALSLSLSLSFPSLSRSPSPPLLPLSSLCTLIPPFSPYVSLSPFFRSRAHSPSLPPLALSLSLPSPPSHPFTLSAVISSTLSFHPRL